MEAGRRADGAEAVRRAAVAVAVRRADGAVVGRGADCAEVASGADSVVVEIGAAVKAEEGSDSAEAERGGLMEMTKWRRVEGGVDRKHGGGGRNSPYGREEPHPSGEKELTLLVRKKEALTLTLAEKERGPKNSMNIII